MTLREKLMHYTHDLDCGSDLKQEAITTIEHIAQYMDEDELLHHSRPLAIAYLALTEDASAPVAHGEWLLRHEGCGHYWECSVCHENPCIYVTKHTKFCPNCGAKMDGDSDES
jgi:hypothetical protein